MRITRIETFLVPPRWLFVRIESDEGAVGWGEPVLEGRAGTVRAAVHELADLLLGTDPMQVASRWQDMVAGRIGRSGPIRSSAVAGLDQALWDLAGHVRGEPVHRLLGGPVRDRLRMYTWVAGPDGPAIAAATRHAVDSGFTAVKLLGAFGTLGPIDTPAQIEVLVERVAAVRAVLGPARDLAVDFHGRFSPAMAIRALDALEAFDPLFVEEPLLPELGHVLPRITAATSVPIATGERLFFSAQFQAALDAGVAVVQPDLSHAAGISETHRIAGLADSYGAALAPHCPLGPIALAACIQVDLAARNFLVQEQALGIEEAGGEAVRDVVDPEPFLLQEGHLRAPQGPGLGVRVDEQAVRRADRVGHTFRFSPARHHDGSFAEL